MMKKIIITAMLSLSILIVIPNLATAAAMSVSSAKSQGFVGEKPDGMLGSVSTPSSEIVALVETTNNKRLVKYKDVATKRGLTVEQVKMLAGTKLMNEAPAGQYIFKNGAWVKK